MFKVITFKGGLGNQIFQYLFYIHLKNKTKNKIFGYYNNNWLKGHNGLEIQKIFDISLPKSNFLIDFFVLIVRFFNKYSDLEISSSDENMSYNSIYFDGWWHNKCYFFDIDINIEFRPFDLSPKNQIILDHIDNSNSISIHIRRGDYLTGTNVHKYGNICTLSYYRNAIKLMNNEYKNPIFFIFSDDVCWARDNFKSDNFVFISDNIGNNSFVDLFLMTQCKGNIIANSTFSYWGAYFNKNNGFVIYPKKWFNSNDVPPEIFKPNWIGI